MHCVLWWRRRSPRNCRRNDSWTSRLLPRYCTTSGSSRKRHWMLSCNKYPGKNTITIMYAYVYMNVCRLLSWIWQEIIILTQNEACHIFWVTQNSIVYRRIRYVYHLRSMQPHLHNKGFVARGCQFKCQYTPRCDVSGAWTICWWIEADNDLTIVAIHLEDTSRISVQRKNRFRWKMYKTV